MHTNFSLRTSQHDESYPDSPSHSFDDEEEFIDDNSSTSTAGPPPDLPQSTGRWNLATAHSCNSEGNSLTTSLNTRNVNNRTGSFNPVVNQAAQQRSGGGHASRSSGSSVINGSAQNTGTFPIRATPSGTYSGASASVSPIGNSIPYELGRSFRLFNTGRYLGAGSASRQRDVSAPHNTFRTTMLRNMDSSNPNSSAKPGGEAYRDVSAHRSEASPYLYFGASNAPLHPHHHRQNSLFNASYGSNLNGSMCFHSHSPELRNASMVFSAGGVTPFSQAGGAAFLPSSAIPLLSTQGQPLQRAYALSADALELAHYAMGGGQLISANVTATQRGLPTLLSTLRSYLALNGRTIIVGDANHAMEMKRGNLVGTGGFAKVFVGLNTCRGELVAIKEIQVVDVDDYTALREIEQEFALLRSLRHPNIVNYYLFEHSRSQKVCRIVMEFLAGDSTLHLLRKFGPLTETILRRITRHLLDAISYIHREGIFHRDIKPANILVSHKGEVKLCDFGCSKRISELSKATSCIIGTPVYMAPELIKGEANHKADIWSMGCTLFELATGLLPWYHSGVKDNLPLMFYITTTSDSPLVLPSAGDASALEFSFEFAQFMELCFTRDPQRRPEAAELLRHPWITGARSVTPSLAPPSSTATIAGAAPATVGSSTWSPRLPATFLSLHAESQDSMVGPRPSSTSPMKGSEPVSPRDSAVVLSNDDSFVSDLAAARLSTSTAVLANSPLGQGEDAVESELHCQQELEEVSATTAIDLCYSLMNFPDSVVKSLEQRLLALGGGDTGTGTAPVTGTGTSESSPPITRTFSVPSQSLASHRGPISTSIVDFPSPGASPEHSILHDNFCYNQAHLGASAGNFVFPSEAAEPPAQQYLRINEDGNLDLATIHEYDSDVLGETVHAKSISADSGSVAASFGSRMVSPGRNSSISRASGSPGLPLSSFGDRRASPQRPAANSGFFLSPRGGGSPSKAAASGGGGSLRGNVVRLPAGAGTVASPSLSPSGQGGGGGGYSVTPPHPSLLQQSQHQAAIPPPPLVTGSRPSPLHLAHSASLLHAHPSSNTATTATSVSSNGGDGSGSSRTQSPSSVHPPQNVSFRQLPDKARVAADGKLHMSFSVSTSPGQELSVPLNVDVSDVHCKMVDNQPSYFVAFSNDIRGQLASRMKEAAAQSQSAVNSSVHSVSSRTTSPRGGLPQSASSTSALADPAVAHQRSLSSSSGAHFYNSPSYRASRSPARTFSHLSSNSTSHSYRQLRGSPRPDGSPSCPAVTPQHPRPSASSSAGSATVSTANSSAAGGAPGEEDTSD